MAEPPRPTNRRWLLAGLSLALLAAAYIPGYFCCGKIVDSALPAHRYAGSPEWRGGPPRWKPVRHRTYSSPWQSVLFAPAAAVESLIVGKEVHATYEQ